MDEERGGQTIHTPKKERVPKGLDGVQRAKQEVQHPNPHAASPSTTSPSHEFSFTISLHPGKNKPPPPPLAAVDLSPAGEIFFHGHLLPLHLLSHLHVSPPRSSTDSCTLPVSGNDNLSCPEKSLLEGSKGGPRKSKSSFSLFRLPKRRKDEDMYGEGQKGKSKFDMTRFLERYIKPFMMSLRNRRRECHMQRHQSYSFSGNWKQRSKGMRGRREISAPASMGNSRTNSGLLVGSGNITPPNNNNNNNNKSDSTMEELQAAIQAAIAHCKNSVAEDTKNKLP